MMHNNPLYEAAEEAKKSVKFLYEVNTGYTLTAKLERFFRSRAAARAAEPDFHRMASRMGAVEQRRDAVFHRRLAA
jgi:hypothetical protein